jgi:hypothetical protein
MLTTAFIVCAMQVAAGVFNLCRGAKNSYPLIDIVFAAMGTVACVGLWPLL